MKQDVLIFQSSCGRFQFYVKSAFKFKCPHYATEDVYNLLNIYKMDSYLHNDDQPAFINFNSKEVGYWFNGVKASEEVGKKLQHNSKFHNKFTDLLNED